MSANDVVLILQIGSLGDTVVSLPCYREIARRHPGADRHLITNYPIGGKMVPAAAILMPTGLIAGCIEYPMPLRQIGQIIELRRRISALKPSVLYYLLPEKRVFNLVRHHAFFRLCGVPRFHGIPWSRDKRYSREVVPGALWESEASRLLRTIGAPSGPPTDEDRDLALSDTERAKADALLRALGRSSRFVAISVGGKVPLNNWGDGNWGVLLRDLSRSRPSLGAVFVGSDDERPRNDLLAAHWEGPRLNACGQLAPRETAALLARAEAFVGHDTGTLHLAAAVDTPIVGIFGARNKPGIWFSDRVRDTFFYNHVACAGCELIQVEACPHDRICMTTHDPARIVAAVHRALTMRDLAHGEGRNGSERLGFDTSGGACGGRI
jgi:ADP-heptose:LPS heptosyltransferase